jgi:glycosyltransferase involved in cell wall biosynthesis
VSTVVEDVARRQADARAPVDLDIALLTGGFDRPYALGLAMALVAQGIRLEVIASDELDSPEMRLTPRLRFLNLHGNQGADAGLARKLARLSSAYGRLLRYAALARPKLFHILWNNKVHFFDRTLLTLYYKLLGKRIAFTAHNVNAGKRDGNDSWLNRLTLKIQYRLVDHIFVHTEKMKNELLEDFGVREQAVTVIPFGINNAVPDTELTPREAKQRLGLGDREKTILFFGNIGPYKGVDSLVTAFQKVAATNPEYRLIIAGKPRGGCEQYLKEIQDTIGRDGSRARVLQKIGYVPDEDTELYFKAADVLVLPYTEVSQSGVLFLGYSFGLPVIATDVGALRDEIVEGRTGFLCRPCDPYDLANTIEAYFQSDVFKFLGDRRHEIREYARQRHSWEVVGETTRKVYEELLGRPS